VRDIRRAGQKYKHDAPASGLRREWHACASCLYCHLVCNTLDLEVT
jgi:hypothetical protein